MNRDDAMAYHPAGVGKMIRDVEAFANDAALKGIDVTPLITASDFHAEISRRAISQSRARKARWHNRIGAAVGVVLLVICLVIIILAAAGIPIAKADPVDELAATVCHAIAAGGGTADVPAVPAVPAVTDA